MADLVAASKKDNRPLQLGNHSAGYQPVAAWLGSASGLTVNHIPYKGGAQMLTDVAGGQLEVGVMDFTGTVGSSCGGRPQARLAVACVAGLPAQGFSP